MLEDPVLGEALAHAEAAVAVFNDERRFLAVNEHYLELTGYRREEIDSHRAGENLRLNPLDQDAFIELITSAVSAGEADITRKDGKRLTVEYVVIPTYANGERVYIGMMWPLA